MDSKNSTGPIVRMSPGTSTYKSRRFQVYVVNRVKFINDHASPDRWRYVESGSSPADEASRGMNARVTVD